ncbi:hypothetical protein ACQ4PT_001674 [Festuca glaucescens]
MDRRRIRVLLVEDEEIHRVVARVVLRAAGVEVEEAENGAEAVRHVRERVTGGGGAYDLILTDKQMPVMDGLESGRADVRACMQATRQIRAMGVVTPIVAVSSDSLPSDVQAFIAAGANDFAPKPLTKEKLGHILAKFGLA